MKKLIISFIIALTLLSVSTVASDEILVGTPTVDGKLDAVYMNSYKIEVNGKDHTFHTSRGGGKEGAFGDSAEAYFLYDDNFLYACIEVKDDAVYSRGAAWIVKNIKALSWENDAVELRLYYNELGEKIKANQYIFQADAFSTATTNYKSMCKDPYTAAATLTDDGYIVEFGVKLSFDTGAGDEIGLSIEIDDLHESITSPTSPMGAHNFNAYGSQAPYENMVKLGEKRAEVADNLPLDSKNHWSKDNISYVLDTKVFSGTGNGFEPDTLMTRAMFVSVLGRIYEMKRGDLRLPDETFSFTDTDYSSWYGKYVKWGSAKGVISGYDNKFSPDAPIKREEMAVIIHRFMSLFENADYTKKSSSFKDGARISSWANSAVEYCYVRGFLSGNENKEFNPQNNATRGEVASVIKRVLRSITIKEY